MIRELTSLDGWEDFIEELNRDPAFSDPMISTPWLLENNLLNAVGKPNDHVLGVYRDGERIGLFDFLILEAEKYAEMIVGLSRDEAAWEEIAGYLRENHAGFRADFVFNPANAVLAALLRRLGASFDEEQQKMVFSGPVPRVDTAGIEPLSPRYMDQYLAMHDDDCYWTGPKVAAAPERFSVWLAVEGGTVLGYMDVTNCFEENEPFALEVKPEYRRRGWGRKLTAKALEANGDRGMMLLTGVGNAPAIALYESLGFVKAEGQNSLTATWIVS